MVRKLNKRKYTRKNLLPTQRILALENSLKVEQEKLLMLEDKLIYSNKHNRVLSDALDQRYTEITELRERNLVLIEAIEILARASVI